MKYKYTVYASATRYYEIVVEANSEKEAKKIAKIMYDKNEMNDYKDELMSIQ